MSDKKILVGDMSRETAIGILKLMLEAMEVYDSIEPTPQRRNAVQMAISSLETDEAYQLEYERTTKDDHHRQNIQAYAHDFGVSEEQAEKELRVTTKNNLAVDCISRVQAQTEIEMNASRYTIARERGGMGQVEWSDQLIKVSDAVDIIRGLPPVTPQEPRKGHWIETAEEYYKAINEKGGGVNEDTDYFVDDIACSECLAKFSVIDNEAERFDFCPCCGSDNK